MSPVDPAGRVGPRVALTGAGDVLRLGFKALLDTQPASLRPRLVDSRRVRPDEVDVVLVGTDDLAAATEKVLRLGCSGFDLVVSFGLDLEPAHRRRLEAAGACAHLGLDLTAEELVAALGELPEQRRRQLLHRSPLDDPLHVALELAGCTPREAQVLTLILLGRSNHEIAVELSVGINTVKTHVRTAYRKIGVTTRTRAVLWGVDHGL